MKQNGQFRKLTDEHTPGRPDECSRIIRNNGFVCTKDNVVRVDGNIAVSRAIGDPQYKDYLIPEPDTETFKIDEDDDLLILSTDGLFMVYSIEEVTSMIHTLRLKNIPVGQISKQVVDACCESYDCKDNVTLLIIDLKKHLQEVNSLAFKAPEPVVQK